MTTVLILEPLPQSTGKAMMSFELHLHLKEHPQLYELLCYNEFCKHYVSDSLDEESKDDEGIKKMM